MKAMTLRLPDETYERLRQEAFDKRVSITSLIVAALGERREDVQAEARRAMSDAIAETLHARYGWGEMVRTDTFNELVRDLSRESSSTGETNA